MVLASALCAPSLPAASAAVSSGPNGFKWSPSRRRRPTASRGLCEIRPRSAVGGTRHSYSATPPISPSRPNRAVTVETLPGGFVEHLRAGECKDQGSCWCSAAAWPCQFMGVAGSWWSSSRRRPGARQAALRGRRLRPGRTTSLLPGAVDGGLAEGSNAARHCRANSRHKMEVERQG